MSFALHSHHVINFNIIWYFWWNSSYFLIVYIIFSYYLHCPCLWSAYTRVGWYASLHGTYFSDFRHAILQKGNFEANIWKGIVSQLFQSYKIYQKEINWLLIKLVFFFDNVQKNIFVKILRLSYFKLWIYPMFACFYTFATINMLRFSLLVKVSEQYFLQIPKPLFWYFCFSMT